MVKLQSKHGATLHTLEDLRKSGFGRPSPRHGLQLLYWFVNDGLEFDFYDNMLAQCHPEQGDYGFHHFGNFEKILPLIVQNSRETYYEVGNLNPERYPEALNLPEYVRENYGMARNFYKSNKDRIIVRYKSPNLILKVYITQHQSEGFDTEHTHLLGHNLIQDIKHADLDLGTFLRQAGFTSYLTWFPPLHNIISSIQYASGITDNRSESESMPLRRERIQDSELGLPLSDLHAASCTLKMSILGGIIALILLVVLIVTLYFLGVF
ncbi:hypothetical protein AALO_G00005630 [Alosa alosa]|uniref:Uncharacterized protein n=1 Tax=Alosa alosa TaxID=278164 RepID=A0AAV6HE49_9TELE|nr:uncharacterized protein LOC125305417 [Alosa alosa]KAG5285634.1 hypothetical protein AALO_G00005630 [Alosa alosa]